jgi:hypothetical protein
MRRQLLLRLAFLVVLCGGLFLWQRARAPQDLTLMLDLSSARPGEITGCEVLVKRGGEALARHEVEFEVRVRAAHPARLGRGAGHAGLCRQAGAAGGDHARALP